MSGHQGPPSWDLNFDPFELDYRCIPLLMVLCYNENRLIPFVVLISVVRATYRVASFSGR